MDDTEQAHSLLELDHVTIFVTPGAPELAGLEALGLRPLGEKTDHEGMGTAGTSVFFDNLYIELVWITDKAIAESIWGSAGVNTGGRAPGGAALPFGLVLRPYPDIEIALPFPATHVAPHAPYPMSQIRVAGEDYEPLYLVIPEPLQYPAFREHLPVPSHPIGVKRVTGVMIATPYADRLTPIEEWLQDEGVVRFEEGAAPLLEITCDAGAQNKMVDARPSLPLVLRY